MEKEIQEIDRVNKEVLNRRKQSLLDASAGRYTHLTVGQFEDLRKEYGIPTQKLINND
jgi:hypothetical protein